MERGPHCNMIQKVSQSKHENYPQPSVVHSIIRSHFVTSQFVRMTKMRIGYLKHPVSRTTNIVWAYHSSSILPHPWTYRMWPRDKFCSNQLTSTQQSMVFPLNCSSISYHEILHIHEKDNKITIWMNELTQKTQKDQSRLQCKPNCKLVKYKKMKFS